MLHSCLAIDIFTDYLYSMKKIAAFDFDGTITQKDTLIEFLQFTHSWKFYLYLLFLSPLLIAFKLGLIKNGKAKQLLFSFFYKGWRVEKFNKLCVDFTKTIDVRRKALDTINKHLKNGDEIVVISASLENWVQPWSENHKINWVLASKIEVIDGKITGRFSGKNCYGMEKVNRLKELFPNRSDYYLIAYGDSKGDKELLEYADERYLRIF